MYAHVEYWEQVITGRDAESVTLTERKWKFVPNIQTVVGNFMYPRGGSVSSRQFAKQLEMRAVPYLFVPTRIYGDFSRFFGPWECLSSIAAFSDTPRRCH